MSSTVTCKICGGKFISLFPAHLKKHGLNIASYLAIFPGSPIWTDEISKKRSLSATRANTGRVLSKKSKEKISKSLLGHKQSDETKLKKHRAKIGKSFGRDQGKNTNEYGYGFGKYIRRQVLKRDEHRCQELGCRATKRLSPHHLDFNKKNNDMCNLITLCKSCHVTIHWVKRKAT